MQSPAMRLLTGHSSDNHVVQFYDGEDYLASVVADFLAAGLASGEPAVVIATPAHREAFLEQLRDKGFDITLAQQKGQLTLLDARQTLAKCLADGRPDWELFQATISEALERARGVARRVRVRAYGEMVDLLWQDGRQQAAHELEEHWNRLAAEFSFSLLCAYSMKRFSGDAHSSGFARICALHTHVLPAESYDDRKDDADKLREIALLQQRARALEAEVAQRKKIENDLRGAVATRDEFLSIAGHELRTPLTPLLINSEALLRAASAAPDDALSQRVLGYAETTTRQLRRLSSLVNELLDVSRIASGNFEIQTDRVDFAELVREVVQRFTPEAARAGCELSVTAPEELEGRSDKLRLEQVLSNLIDNALKYAPGRPIRIELKPEGERVSLAVIDQGMGIAKDSLSRVFDRFERGVPATAYGGLGLGLYIARTIVESLGGQIWAESVQGQGATFSVVVPR